MILTGIKKGGKLKNIEYDTIKKNKNVQIAFTILRSMDAIDIVLTDHMTP